MLVQELPRRPGDCLPDVITGQPEWRGGYLLPNNRPGLSITLNAAALANHSFEKEELPHLEREGGSFTNW